MALAGGARVVWRDNSGALLSIDLAKAGSTPQQIAASLSKASILRLPSFALSVDKTTVYYTQPDGIYACSLQ